MSIISAALRELMAAGLEGDALVEAVARIEQAQEPVQTARQKRNRRYYRSEKGQAAHAKASEKRLNASYSSESDVQDGAAQKESSPTPPQRKTKNPPSGVKKGEPVYSAEFERFRQAYPKRDGSHDWPKASESFESHRRAGVDPEDIIRGAEAYAAQCRRSGKEGSEFVKQAVSFVRGRLWPEWLEKAAPKPVDGWPLSWSREACRTAFLAGSWPAGIGCPAPGLPGCKVPESVQREWAAEKAAQTPARNVA